MNETSMSTTKIIFWIGERKKKGAGWKPFRVYMKIPRLSGTEYPRGAGLIVPQWVRIGIRRICGRRGQEIVAPELDETRRIGAT